MKKYISPQTDIVSSAIVGVVLMVSNNAGLNYSENGIDPNNAW